MTPEGECAAQVIRTAIAAGESVEVALREAGFGVIAAPPAQSGEKHITFWTPDRQLITLRLAISPLQPALTIEEIRR